MRIAEYYHDSPYAKRSVHFAALCFFIATILSFSDTYWPIAVALAIPPLTVALAFTSNLIAPGKDDVAIARVWSALGQAVTLLLLPAACYGIAVSAVHNSFPTL